MPAVTATFKNGVFAAEYDGITAELNYEEVRQRVEELRAEHQNESWYDILILAARSLAMQVGAIMDFMVASDLMGKITAAVTECLLNYFQRYISTVMDTMCEIVSYGFALVLKFVDWLKSFFF